MKFLSKRVGDYTSFHSDLDPQKHGRSSGGVSLFIHKSLATHVQFYESHSSRILSMDLYFKGNIKLRIFVVYIPPTNDMVLRNEVIDHLISLVSLATTQNFYHAICGDFNMNLDKYYPIYTQQPQAASQRVHRLFHHLLSHGYEDYTPLNLAPNLGTYQHLDTVTRIDFVWSCPLLCRYMLTASIFDAHDMHISDHNPIITYFDASLLSDAIKPARARQLGRDTRRVFKFDSVSTEQWTAFADELDNLCSIDSTTFGAWPLNQKCEYIHSRIIKAAKSKLPSVTVGNTYTPKKPKDLESLIQSYRFLSKVAKTIRLLHKTPTLYSSRYESKWTTFLIRLNNIYLAYNNIFTTPASFPSFLYEGRNDDFASLLKSLENMTLLLQGFLLLKEREFQTSSIQAKIDTQSLWIILQRPTLLTSSDAIDKKVVDHFQNFVPITSSPPSSIRDLPDRWSNAYEPLVDVNPSIFGSLMDPPTLEEWSSTISSMPNDKAPGPSMISYEMLKHLGPHASSLLLSLVGTCLSDANIPDLWRHATVFPIPKPHEWKSPLLASYSILQGGNFAGLPRGSCRDPIITLESIIHDSVVTKHPLWILSQDISKAFDSVDLTMLKFALQRLRLPHNAIQFLLSLFMARSNHVITAHGPTPSYRVRIGIDQGEVISPLLWVIYIDPLLTVLKNERIDPYTLISPSIPTTLSSATNAISTTQDLAPIVFNLTPSSLNATATIIVTPIPMSSSFRFLGVWFNINGSRNFIRKQLKQECNSFSAILRPAKLTSQQVVYLHNTVLIPKLEYRMQVTHLSKAECSTAAASVRTLVKYKAKLSRSTPDAILYLSQALGLINLFSHQQQSHFTNLFLLANSSSFFMKSLFLYRLRFIQFFFLIPISPLMVLDWAYWSSLTLFKQDYIASTIASLVSTPFRLSRTNLSSVPDLAYPNGHTPLYQCLSIKIFKSSLHRLRKRGFFYLSQLLTPQGTHLLSWSVIYANSTQKLGHARVTKWYQDLLFTVTDPSQPGLLLEQFVSTQPVQSVTKNLTPCIPLVGSKKRWIVTLDNDCFPLFGKQLSFQPTRSTCIVVHWISDCSSRPGDLITLKPYPGCDFNMYKSSYKKKPVSIGSVSCACSVPLPESLILPTNKTSITANTSQIVATVSWAEIVDFVTNFIRCHSGRLVASTIPSPAPLMDNTARPVTMDLITAADVAASSPVVITEDSCYTFYTDGSLINLGTDEVSMGWGWVQIVQDSGFLNSIAAYKHGVIYDWPSSSRAEAAAVYAALSASPANSTIKIYTDSQTAIDDLKHCSSSTYSNSRLYYKTTNFELWAIIQKLIVDKNLTVLPFKVKAHSNFYWNDFADSLANTAHAAEDSILISRLDLAAAHDFILEYDGIVCESNPRQLFKQYHQMLYMKDLLELSRFRFLSMLSDSSSYVVNWALTWHTLLFQPKHDDSFTQANASLHYAMKFQLFLEELPTLESLKRLRPDLYIDILTCRSCEDQLEDFMHLFMCKKRRVKLQQLLNSYLRHLTTKITEAGDNAHCDFSAQIDRIISLPCWSFSSSNWSSYSLVRGCLPSAFLDVFMELDIPRLSAMNVIAAIHNNFINKFRKWIWNPRSYDKGNWEHAMNITSKLKNSPKPKGLPKSLYLPYSSLPPPTHVFSRDSETDWLKNSMQYGLTWFDHISGFMGRLTVLLNNSFCRMECRF
ncbi:unnamed protein product [Rhizophagus irregularis]|nr:unnamed protein product [Rhizophagus irregularis]